MPLKNSTSSHPSKIQPVTDRILPTINNSILGTAVGWGVTEQGESSAVLREVST